MGRAVLYCRISQDRIGDEDRRADPLQRQEEACRGVATARGHEVVAVVQDRSYSAYDRSRERPGWSRVLSMVERGEVDVVIAHKLDRIARRLDSVAELVRLAEDTGVSVLTADGDLDLSTAQGRMMAGIIVSVAQFEVERKAERHRAANQQRRAQGLPYTSGSRTFGYDRAGQIVEGEAGAIRAAVSGLLAGTTTYAEVARQWTAAGLREGAKWTPEGVRRALSSARLAGRVTYLDEEVGDSVWEPIIDYADHLAMLALVESRKSGGRRATSLLGGIARCGKCGAKVKAARKSTGELVYRCPSSHVYTPREAADAWAATLVAIELGKVAMSGQIVVVEEADGPSEEVAELQQRLDALSDSYADGLINIRQLERATAALRQRIEAARASEAAKVTRPFGAGEVADLWLNAESVEGRRAVLEMFEITLKPRGRGRQVPISQQVFVTWPDQTD